MASWILKTMRLCFIQANYLYQFLVEQNISINDKANSEAADCRKLKADSQP